MSGAWYRIACCENKKYIQRNGVLMKLVACKPAIIGIEANCRSLLNSWQNSIPLRSAMRISDMTQSNFSLLISSSASTAEGANVAGLAVELLGADAGRCAAEPR